MAPISHRKHRYPMPRWKFTPYVAKRPGYVPPLHKESRDGFVNPHRGFRIMDERTQNRKEGLGGPYTRMSKLQDDVTNLIKWERVEMHLNRGQEVRQYLERIIHTAALYGPKDPEAMKLADYYINEKALIHKLFKVVVPRFETSQLTFGSYTRMYRLRPLSDGLTPGHGRERCVLEIVGHPFPQMEPAITKPHENNLLNVLLGRLRDRFEPSQRLASNSLAQSSVSPLSIKLHQPNKVDAFETEHKLDGKIV
ncbi:large ribosomal subunit protein bL17m-like isoform X1 [Convolutriloba macropyga]|uniref:large ribosomal subunit protein bL17m-like isoform X1 n=1 Tax=Convolutriloba macropyga TaxID=536237 RepID=UPI003F526F62